MEEKEKGNHHHHHRASICRDTRCSMKLQLQQGKRATNKSRKRTGPTRVRPQQESHTGARSSLFVPFCYLFHVSRHHHHHHHHHRPLLGLQRDINHSLCCADDEDYYYKHVEEQQEQKTRRYSCEHDMLRTTSTHTKEMQNSSSTTIDYKVVLVRERESY
jgi:hypothetical protein